MKHVLTLKNHDTDYRLIAIRTKIDDYRFAYLLNKSPFFFFKRMGHDLQAIINRKTVFFPTFECNNVDKERISFLINAL